MKSLITNSSLMTIETIARASLRKDDAPQAVRLNEFELTTLNSHSPMVNSSNSAAVELELFALRESFAQVRNPQAPTHQRLAAISQTLRRRWHGRCINLLRRSQRPRTNRALPQRPVSHHAGDEDNPPLSLPRSPDDTGRFDGPASPKAVC